MKKIFTILHTNDIHSNLIGMGPSSDYTPFALNDDPTRGGFARLATLLGTRKAERLAQGPVLILDGGDYSMGTAFGAAIRETGGELQLLSLMGCDATTFGNHEFDLGPDGTAQAIAVAAKAGRVPTVVVSNTDFSGDDATLAGFKRLAKEGVIRRHLVIERGGIRFGLFGVIGKEASSLAMGAGATKFADPVQTAREMVALLRETEKVDVVIALSHGGMVRGEDGRYIDGEDVRLPKAVPGIDVVIGSHSHTELPEPVIVNGRTPVVQTGKYAENLGELVIELDGEGLTVQYYRLHPIDDTIPGDQAMADEVEKVKKLVTGAAFASRGYSIDQPLAVVPRDLPNTFTDIAAGTILANLCTDAFRNATNADIGFTVYGLIRSPLTRGKTGVQTVYDVFAVTPLWWGVVDPTAGSALLTGYLTGQELKHMLEYWLVDNPTHPGEWFPRVSGMRFRYDLTRAKFDAVTAVELGDFDRGYRPIDISGKDARLYSLTCPVMLGPILMAIPKLTNGLAFVPKNKAGQALKSRQAIMDHLRRLPVERQGDLPVIPVDARAAEVRAIDVSTSSEV